MKIAVDRQSVNHALKIASAIAVIAVSAILALFIMIILPQSYKLPFALCLFALSIGIMIFMSIKNGKENKRIEELLEFLYKECDAEKFVKKSEELIESTKSKNFLNSLRLNLALGYDALGKPVTAIAVTKKTKIKAFDKVSWAIYYNNLAMYYAEIGDSDNATYNLKNAEKYIKKVRKSLPEENILLTKGMVAFSQGEFKTAKNFFTDAKKAEFSNKHTGYLNDLYTAKALAKLSKENEAKTIFKRLAQKKTLPYITKAASSELNNI